MKYDNPAGRLLEILTVVSKYDKATQAREVWTNAFGLPANDLSPKLTATLGKAMMLPFEAVALLEDDYPDLTSPPPSWVGQVSGAFQAHNVHGTIDTFKNNISSETLANIRLTAVLLDKGSKRKSLQQEELDRMQDGIEAVLSEVRSSQEIDADLRIYLVRALRKIITSIEEYQLTGANPILESIEQAVGHAMVDPQYKSFLVDSELGQRIFEALQAASGIVTVAVGMPMLMQAAQQFLK